MSPANFPVEGEVANREGSQIGDLPLYKRGERYRDLNLVF